MTDAVMFGSDGRNLLPAQILYKKKAKKNTQVIFEVTLSDFRTEGEINERDFLERAELFCSLGITVMINY